MCGRFGFKNSDTEKIRKRFRLKKIAEPVQKSYNIAPGQNIAAILNDSPDELSYVRWGLVPFWAKEEAIGYKMINARSETIFEKPAFRASIKKKRCLIPADFFFEWKKEEDGKQPYCIRFKSDESFCFAGIWDQWDKGESPLRTCSIITCEPNDLLAEVHDRMPVILSPEHEEDWLSGNNIKDLLKPMSASQFEFFKVSKLVNSPQNNSEEVLQPL